MADGKARGQDQAAIDRRYMAAAIRLSRKHSGLTSTNPSVATLIVRDDGDGPVIVGRGVTAIGGRPHAETEALAEAGALARGATAYVTLEPCAHHGRTPPCANALVNAGVARVVGAASDPDDRVSGKGYAILRAAGIEVVEGVLADEAADAMAGYLIRSVKKRPEVILKLALSVDGMIGKPGEGQIAITGEVARRQVHLMRAGVDAVIIGIRTALEDDPELTVRLPGLSGRSPARIVLDRQARLSPESKLAATARDVPLLIAACAEADAATQGRTGTLRRADSSRPKPLTGGSPCRNCLRIWPRRACRACLSKAARRPPDISSMKAWSTASCCSRAQLSSAREGIAAPIDRDRMPPGFRLLREATFGDDRYAEWARAI